MASRKPLVLGATGRATEVSDADVLLSAGAQHATLTVTTTATLPTPATGDNSQNAATTAFAFIGTGGVVSVATTGGTTTLTPAQHGYAGLIFTGTLTSNAVIVVPFTGRWIVANRCTGAFTLTVQPATGTGVACTAGFTADLVADGTNVLVAGSDFASLNVAGMGSTELAGAWTATTSPVTAVTGTFTSATCAIRYKKLGRMVFVQVRVSITTVGTASGFTRITLPFANNATTDSFLPGRDTLSGVALGGPISPSSAVVNIVRYDSAAAPIAAGAVFILEGFYEAAA